MNINVDKCLDKYSKIIKIRVFEEYLLELFIQNKLSGTIHTYIGEEATAVAVMRYIRPQDFVFSNHRCHGHYLAYGGSEEELLAEIMSKKTGLCQGRGGSQHIHYKNFFTNGIQGGIVPNAVGIGLANKLSKSDSNSIVFLGDGTLGQGVVYEAMNIASIYQIPVVFIIEDNQYAMSTKRSEAIAGDIKERISGFNIWTQEITSTDVDELEKFFSYIFSYVDENRKPVCGIVHNYRLCAHSKGDDTRDKKEIEEYKKKDPIKTVKERIGEDNYEQIYYYYQKRFEKIACKLEKEGNIKVSEITLAQQDKSISFLCERCERCVDRIRTAFDNELRINHRLVLIGEDIRDPYGGAFKVTKGLSEKFDNQVLNMPISENCMIGMAVGMALNNKLPVVEMMFGDFITLGFDQILNHAAKYAWIYGNNIEVPMVVRIPSGAKRGYGPTHSQSLEKYLIGIPLIRVLALSLFHDPLIIYEVLFKNLHEPTVIIENKNLYGERTIVANKKQYKIFTLSEINHYGFSSLHLSIDLNCKPDIYAVTYGGMSMEVLQASEELIMQDEIQMDVIILSQLSPIPIEDIKHIIRKDVPLVVIEEGTKVAGIGAEIIACCIENKIGNSFFRIASCDMPIPNGIVLENQIIPNKNEIVKRIREYCNDV